MSPLHPATFAGDPADRLAQDRARIEGRLVMLTRLAEIGMGIAEDAGRMSRALAEGGGAAADGPDPALAYARAARAVRLTLALQSRLMQELADLDRAEHLVRFSRARARRDQAQRLIEQAIEVGRDDEDEIERLSLEAWERLGETDDADIAGLAFDAVVARIAKDLGLALDEAGLTGAAEGPAGLNPLPLPVPFARGGPPEGDGAETGAGIATRPCVHSSA